MKNYLQIIISVLMMILSTSCTGDEFFTGEEYNLGSYEQTGVFCMDHRNPGTPFLQPLGSDTLLVFEIPAAGCDTIINFKSPGILRQVGAFNEEYPLPGREDAYVSHRVYNDDVIKFDWSGSNEEGEYPEHIWRFEQRSAEFDGLKAMSKHPMQLRLIFEPNESSTEKKFVVGVGIDYQDRNWDVSLSFSEEPMKGFFEYFWGSGSPRYNVLLITQASN